MDSLKSFISEWLRKIPQILAALLVVLLLGAGVGLGVLLRSLNWEQTSIIIPSLIFEVFTCVVCYRFVSNFFPKKAREFSETTKKSSRTYTEPEAQPENTDSELPKRNIKQRN
jgi:hypothetical protein